MPKGRLVPEKAELRRDRVSSDRAGPHNDNNPTSLAHSAGERRADSRLGEYVGPVCSDRIE